MTRKTGRNDLCPCGSGKKYKNCCLKNPDEAEFGYRRWRQVEAALIPKLIAYAIETVGDQGIEDAWSEFHDDPPPGEHDPESEMNLVFMPWFLFNWQHTRKLHGSRRASVTTIADAFFVERRPSVDEAKLILSAHQTTYSLCEVTESRPGHGLTLFDLIRRVKYDVIEHTASRSVKKGEIIYCGTTDLDGIKSNIGTSPYALRPTAKQGILELRKWIVEDCESDELTADHLVEFEADIRAYYLDEVDAMLRPPQLVNTDKEPFVPQSIHFEVQSADSAFHALKDLAEDTSEDELLSRATLKKGVIVSAEIPWLGGTEEARRRLAGPVLLGVLKVTKTKLVVSVNSTNRAETIRRLVEERLGMP